MVETSSWWVGTYMRCIVDDVGTYWWVIVDYYLKHDWYILGTWLDALVYGTGWLQVVWHRLVHGWCTCLCWQIDICWGLLPHLIWCWECKLSLAYRVGLLVDFYSIMLFLKNPRIEVHTKKKNCTNILCSLCSLWRWFVDDMLLICIHI